MLQTKTDTQTPFQAGSKLLLLKSYLSQQISAHQLSVVLLLQHPDGHFSSFCCLVSAVFRFCADAALHYLAVLAVAKPCELQILLFAVGFLASGLLLPVELTTLAES